MGALVRHLIKCTETQTSVQRATNTFTKGEFNDGIKALRIALRSANYIQQYLAKFYKEF